MTENKIRADMVPALITQRPVVILVPDPSDVCGVKKIPRRVTGAFCTDTAHTHGRWTLYFDQTDGYAAALVTAAHHEYELTTTDKFLA
ncbi:hypothetical protein [Lentzea jiangxiensis]|uniref:Uncharacterized protein n=1 Tax=Lentzea jiangxiensis TaxID=641025 RepID=A0A1H0X6Z5_9PSEU|nr:hypothetical protein [Lentzea jiangxiensis]SDP98515.1 hypothetical protein SAMN05421507_14026 [Lentzea jiangxiensis]